MSVRILSVAASLVPLIFFPTFVIASGINVTATCTSPSFGWTFNSLGQSPCVTAAYMYSTCHGGSYFIDPLAGLPASYSYSGPDEGFSDKCDCSTVGYSLISACVACQGHIPFSWSVWTANCTSDTRMPPSQFPNPVPAGTSVPHWASLDVTNENNWNANESYIAGDTPEYGPGAIFGASGVSTPGVTSTRASSTAPSTASSTHSQTPQPAHSGGKVGAIAGGAIGGIVVISMAAAAIFYILRRRSPPASAGAGSLRPMLNDGSVVQSVTSGSPTTMRFYDPSDPTTYPGYQGGPRSLDIASGSHVPLPSHIGSGSTLEVIQTSPQLPVKGYHGLPMPSA